jgi:UMF1 family MFS transporter
MACSPSPIRYVYFSIREAWVVLIRNSRQSSSFIGPLVVGLVADLTSNIRYAFLFLIFMLWASLPVLAGVDVERGRADARAWSSDGNDEYEVEEEHQIA